MNRKKLTEVLAIHHCYKLQLIFGEHVIDIDGDRSGSFVLLKQFLDTRFSEYAIVNDILIAKY